MAQRVIIIMFSSLFWSYFSILTACLLTIEHVLIYDWDGKPIKHLMLEKPIYGNLNYDSETHILYGIGYDPEGMILEYDLNRIKL